MALAMGEVFPKTPRTPEYNQDDPLMGAPGLSQGSVSSIAAPAASSAAIASQAQPSSGEEVPPPPLPVACPRHRKGRGWSLLDPCEP